MAASSVFPLSVRDQDVLLPLAGTVIILVFAAWGSQGVPVRYLGVQSGVCGVVLLLRRSGSQQPPGCPTCILTQVCALLHTEGTWQSFLFLVEQR